MKIVNFNESYKKDFLYKLSLLNEQAISLIKYINYFAPNYHYIKQTTQKDNKEENIDIIENNILQYWKLYYKQGVEIQSSDIRLDETDSPLRPGSIVIFNSKKSYDAPSVTIKKEKSNLLIKNRGFNGFFVPVYRNGKYLFVYDEDAVSKYGYQVDLYFPKGPLRYFFTELKEKNINTSKDFTCKSTYYASSPVNKTIEDNNQHYWNALFPLMNYIRLEEKQAEGKILVDDFIIEHSENFGPTKLDNRADYLYNIYIPQEIDEQPHSIQDVKIDLF